MRQRRSAVIDAAVGRLLLAEDLFLVIRLLCGRFAGKHHLRSRREVLHVVVHVIRTGEGLAADIALAACEPDRDRGP